jgi:hypothetical protein
MSSVEVTRFISKYSDYTNLDIHDQNSTAQALSQFINKTLKEGKADTIIEFLEDFILSAYGEKSADGKRFMKSAKIREDFSYSIAYATLFEELITDEKKLGQFMDGVIDNAAKN